MLVLTEPIAQKPARRRRCAERLRQRRDLDRIAERGAGAVRLDVGDRRRLDARDAVRRAITSACPSTLGAV